MFEVLLGCRPKVLLWLKSEVNVWGILAEVAIFDCCDFMEIGKYVVADGVRRCAGISTFAAISLVPYVAGIGVAVAVDIPVNVEACQYVTGSVEYLFNGIGLAWSSPGVREASERAAYKYLLEGIVFVHDIISYIEAMMGGVGVEAASASLLGKSVVVMGTSNIPIPKFDSAWFVVMRPLEDMKSSRFEVDEKVLNVLSEISRRFISEPLSALIKHSEIVPKMFDVNEDILNIVDQNGIDAITTVSGYGNYYVGILFSESDARLLVNYWRKYGPTVCSRILI